MWGKLLWVQVSETNSMSHKLKMELAQIQESFMEPKTANRTALDEETESPQDSVSHFWFCLQCFIEERKWRRLLRALTAPQEPWTKVFHHLRDAHGATHSSQLLLVQS